MGAVECPGGMWSVPGMKAAVLSCVIVLFITVVQVVATIAGFLDAVGDGSNRFLGFFLLRFAFSGMWRGRWNSGTLEFRRRARGYYAPDLPFPERATYPPLSRD